MTKNVTVQKILSILLSRIKFIILITLLTTILFFVFSKFFIAPQYNASSMIYVQNYDKTGSSNEKNSKILGSDINGSASLAGVCVTLFENSDQITSLYNGCRVSMTVNEGTFFITISVSGNDPQVCANVANQIADETQNVFGDHFQYGQCGKIRDAKVPERPYSPNNLKNTLIGFVVGLAVSCVISILIELVDTTIKSDDDIQEMYDLPVFAEIPDFDGQGR